MVDLDDEEASELLLGVREGAVLDERSPIGLSDQRRGDVGQREALAQTEHARFDEGACERRVARVDVGLGGPVFAHALAVGGREVDEKRVLHRGQSFLGSSTILPIDRRSSSS
jgi:hypothetical protein